MLSSSCQTPFWYDLLQNFSTTYIITNMQNVKEILDLMKSLAPQDGAVIEKAYMVAEKAHDGQKRFTGDPYVKHSFETAKNLAVFGMDRDTIIAGLLHDALEDGNITSEVIEKEFGKEVLFLVQGVTKLGKLKYQGVERHVESLRKMFIATAQDMRVLIIKLADRLHNIKTLYGPEKKDKHRRIALESLERPAAKFHQMACNFPMRVFFGLNIPNVYPEDYK